MKKKILFIINPNAGTYHKNDVEGLIDTFLDKDQYVAHLKLTEYAGHATVLARESVEQQFDITVSVGGDGTMNEVGSGLVGSTTALSIVPCGSGNGLARHLSIPMDMGGAIDMINHGIVKEMDVCTVNDKYFFNVGGIGFDGLIAKEFSTLGTRGFWTYIYCIMKNFFIYRAKRYRIVLDDKEQFVSAKIIAFANAEQYGNNFIIAPGAEIDSGMMEVCIVGGFFQLISLRSGIEYLFGKYYRNDRIKTKRAAKILIESEDPLLLQIDGESVDTGTRAEIHIIPKGLKIVTKGTQ